MSDSQYSRSTKGKIGRPKVAREAVDCAWCGARFYERPSRRAKFCSKQCSTNHRFDDVTRHPRWKQGRTTTLGYVLVYVEGRGHVREHRLIMETHLGRRLQDFEKVHHINEDKTDNRLANLMLVSQAEHMRIHNTLQRWARHYDCCVSCGKSSRVHVGHGLCSLCSYRQKNNIAYIKAKDVPL